MMGGIEWEAMPVIVDVLGITDVDLLIKHLTTIRDFQREHG